MKNFAYTQDEGYRGVHTHKFVYTHSGENMGQYTQFVYTRNGENISVYTQFVYTHSGENTGECIHGQIRIYAQWGKRKRTMLAEIRAFYCTAAFIHLSASV